MGLTQEGLVEYAESLNNSADQIAAVNPVRASLWLRVGDYELRLSFIHPWHAMQC